MDMMVEPGAASHHYGPRSGRRVRMSTPRRPYRTDLSDARWALIEPTLSAWRAGRVGLGISPIQHDLREILNAILYVNRTGIAWEYLPHDFPPYKTVHGSSYVKRRTKRSSRELSGDGWTLARMGDQRLVDLAGDVALEASNDLFGGLALGGA